MNLVSDVRLVARLMRAELADARPQLNGGTVRDWEARRGYAIVVFLTMCQSVVLFGRPMTPNPAGAAMTLLSALGAAMAFAAARPREPVTRPWLAHLPIPTSASLATAILRRLLRDAAGVPTVLVTSVWLAYRSGASLAVAVGLGAVLAALLLVPFVAMGLALGERVNRLSSASGRAVRGVLGVVALGLYVRVLALGTAELTGRQVAAAWPLAWSPAGWAVRTLTGTDALAFVALLVAFAVVVFALSVHVVMDVEGVEPAPSSIAFAPLWLPPLIRVDASVLSRSPWPLVIWVSPLAALVVPKLAPHSATATLPAHLPHVLVAFLSGQAFVGAALALEAAHRRSGWCSRSWPVSETTRLLVRTLLMLTLALPTTLVVLALLDGGARVVACGMVIAAPAGVARASLKGLRRTWSWQILHTLVVPVAVSAALHFGSARAELTALGVAALLTAGLFHDAIHRASERLEPEVASEVLFFDDAFVLLVGYALLHGPLFVLFRLASVRPALELALLVGPLLALPVAMRWRACPRFFGPGWGLAAASGIGLGAAASAVAAFQFALFGDVFGPALASGPATSTLFRFALVVTAPLIEELVFRGMIFRRLREHMPFVGAAAISAGAFAALHPHVGFVPLLALGFVTAFAYERHRLLIAPVMAHAVYNVVVLLVRSS